MAIFEILFCELTLHFRHNLKEHYDGTLYECHCGSICKSKRNLEHHQETHTEKEICEVCDKQCSTRNTLRRHWNLKHVTTHGTFKYSRSKFIDTKI